MSDQSADLVFYNAPQSRSTIVHWMLEELGQPYRTELVNLKKNEQKQPNYLRVNPMGKVPALVHRGVAISEAAAICTYLADAFPQAGLSMPPGDPARGPYLRWLFFGPSTLEPALIDRMLGRTADQPGTLPYGDWEHMLGVIAQGLSRGPYLMGERFTAADVVIGSGLRWGTMMNLIPARPEFTAYGNRLGERTALKRMMAKDQEQAASLGG